MLLATTICDEGLTPSWQAYFKTEGIQLLEIMLYYMEWVLLYWWHFKTEFPKCFLHFAHVHCKIFGHMAPVKQNYLMNTASSSAYAWTEKIVEGSLSHLTCTGVSKNVMKFVLNAQNFYFENLRFRVFTKIWSHTVFKLSIHSYGMTVKTPYFLHLWLPC